MLQGAPVSFQGMAPCNDTGWLNYNQIQPQAPFIALSSSIQPKGSYAIVILSAIL